MSGPTHAPAEQLQRPALLREGDAVMVIAPAGPVDEGRLDRGLDWLTVNGLQVVEGDALRGRTGHGLPFLAASDDERRRDLIAGLQDPHIKAVLAGRGGDGTPRVLDTMPWRQLSTLEPTIVAGLSDITCLHQAVAANLGWASLWSPMVASAPIAASTPDGWSRSGLLASLFADAVDPVVLRGDTLVDAEPVTAPLVGGTLALLSAMIGTPGCHPATGAILMIEDIGERSYRLERFLTHLRRSGFLEGVLGVAVGDLTDCSPAEDVITVIRDGVGDRSDLGVPVITGLSFGHGPRQASLWLGRDATLDPAHGTLTQSRPA